MSRNRAAVSLSLFLLSSCSGPPGDEGVPEEPEHVAPSFEATDVPGVDEGAMIGRYEIDPYAIVDKDHVFTTFRRTTNGTTQMMPRSTHICVLSDVQGDFNETCPNNTCELAPRPAIFPSGGNWALRRDNESRNIGSICYRHSNFTAPAGSFTMWTEGPGFASISSGWPSCTSSTSVTSWHGDAITFINSVSGEFESSGERVTVTQSPHFFGGNSRGTVRTTQCLGNVTAFFGTYFVGIPQTTIPVYVGVGDVRVWADDSRSEFSVNTNQTAVMARTDSAMCYLTSFSGDLNGNNERVQILPRVVNGVERWHLQSTRGGSSSAQGKARCLAFDQTQLVGPTPQ